MIKKFFLILLKLFLIFIGITVLSVFIFKYAPVPFTPLMILRSFETRPTENDKLTYQWVSIDKISKHMPKAVVKSEDYKFYDHFGFDLEAIEKAIEHNKKNKRKKGASTITQQTAKNLFLWPSRSWIRKGLEAYFTILIELIWSKDRILEVYLNVIELGNHVYGVEAASQKFFKKPALNITAHEAALMAAVLPNPRKFKISAPSNYIIGRQQAILDRLIGKKVETKNDNIQILHDEEYELDIEGNGVDTNGNNGQNMGGPEETQISDQQIKELEQNLEEEFESATE